ncbi:MAG: hypothetical protein NFW04_11380 [Candidatus Accumulibacter sp.]|mgnify:CR=1 FL=1|uniref:hypothetical protein n=1 Tax=Accumulibacter sp. TaxID=2053492 RepID=UPI0025F100AF|nr:hypothetical protein [Accumulibacter sp.]MCM8599241.1 hypothetical protein [Accumulibacter sp.]MCM8663140.1 hypothetical protein [Accumulibacter sp.]
MDVWKLLPEGPYSMSAANGWVNMLDLGRYGKDYETRAFVAYMGLGALTSSDAVYPTTYVDADGRALDAVRHAYRDGRAATVTRERPADLAVSREFLCAQRAQPLWHLVVNAAEIQHRRFTRHLHGPVLSHMNCPNSPPRAAATARTVSGESRAPC